MKIKPAKKLTEVMREVNVWKESSAAAALFKAARKLPAIRLQRILAPTDFSESARAGVRLANSLAERFAASILLTHVVESPVHISRVKPLTLARENRAALNLAETQLNRLVTEGARPGVEISACVRRGKAFHEITTLAGKSGADLIVIATRGQTGLKRVWLGSTAERVVRHAPCPVLTVPAGKPGARGKKLAPVRWKRIVVATDLSEFSVSALPYAAAFARQFDAEIILLHVVEPRFPPPEVGALPPQVVEQNESAVAEDYLQRLRQEVLDDDLSVRTLVRKGVPFQEITRLAASVDADLIILTTHGHTGLKHVLLGSTAERVVRHADCPVLVVRDLARIRRGKRSLRRRPRS